ncbi:MAG TPA: hypothetical protein VM580_03520, partial [Labilithrix sp.]|nr:hypothetical protein [Labilithrix sp.]
MKSNRPLSDIAAKILSSEAREASGVRPKARADAIVAIARAIEQRKRKHRLRRAAFGGAAVAASIALALAFGRMNRQEQPWVVGTPSAAASFVRGSPVVVRRNSRTPLS